MRQSNQQLWISVVFASLVITGIVGCDSKAPTAAPKTPVQQSTAQPTPTSKPASKPALPKQRDPQNPAWNSKSVAEWQAQLKSEDPNKVRDAILALGDYGAAAKAASHDLVKLFGVNQGSYAEEVTETLVNMGPIPVPDLVRELNSKDSQIKDKCVLALLTLGHYATEAAPILRDLARSGQGQLSTLALRSLGTLKIAAKQDFEIIARALRSTDQQRKQNALLALKDIGFGLPAYIDLFKPLANGTADEKTTLVEALASVNPKSAQAIGEVDKILLSILSDANTEVQATVCYSIADFTAYHPGLEAKLKALANGADASVKEAAALALESQKRVKTTAK